MKLKTSQKCFCNADAEMLMPRFPNGLFLEMGHTLLIIPKDAAFAEILVFSNIFGFLAVNWAPKWTETVNLRSFLLSQNSKFWRIFQTLCFSYWKLPMVKVSARSNNIWGSKGQRNRKKGPFPWILNQYKKLWHFLISQPHILYWWNLPQIYILMRSFISQILGGSLIACKMSKKINFLAQFGPFLNTSKNCSISDASSCLSSLAKNVGCFWGARAKNPTKSSVKRQFLLVRKHLKI